MFARHAAEEHGPEASDALPPWPRARPPLAPAWGERPAAQRHFAHDHDLPRSTLRHGLRRREALDASPEEVAFLESAAGVACRHRLLVAAHLTFTEQGPCGLRLPGPFLRLARLDRFVAASYGARQQFGRACAWAWPARPAPRRSAWPWCRRAPASAASARGARGADQAPAQARPKGPGRAPDYAGQSARAERIEAEVAGDVEAARRRQEWLREPLQGFSDADHPFDLETGPAQSAEAVRGRWQGRLQALAGLAGAARLGPKAAEAVAGVGKALGGVVGVVAWFGQRVQAARAGLPEPLRALGQERLLAAASLRRAAGRLRGAARRAAVRAWAEGLVAGLVAPAGVSAAQGGPARRLAEECAGWFVRTCSCVEGRNGQRSLRHHGLHRLSARQRGVRTVRPNDGLRRPDGSTAAGRFFGAEPQNLFAWRLEHLPPPARPARRRLKAA